MCRRDDRASGRRSPEVSVREKKKWSELSPRARAAIVVGGVAEAILTAVALRDLRRRPASSVRGPKVLWLPVFFVQPVGPPLYFLFGRRSPG
jgi:phospholipase D-like protein